jgi:hypothetical protein
VDIVIRAAVPGDAESSYRIIHDANDVTFAKALRTGSGRDIKFGTRKSPAHHCSRFLS